MGMFDSFYIDEEEIQTKQLDCTLQRYKLGDPVESYPTFDGPIGNYYLYEDYEDVGLIIINNIYIDWVKPTENTREVTRELFNSYLKKPELVALKLAKIIQERLHPSLVVATKKLNNITYAISEYEKYKEDPNYEYRFRMLRNEIERFKAGETIESVIAGYLKDE